MGIFGLFDLDGNGGGPLTEGINCGKGGGKGGGLGIELVVFGVEPSTRSKPVMGSLSPKELEINMPTSIGGIGGGGKGGSGVELLLSLTVIGETGILLTGSSILDTSLVSSVSPGKEL